jgi:acetyl-CoA carboxylase biotin carboxylase subunit
MEYDPLLAKLAVWADSRDAAIARMIRALGEYDVEGIRTNIPFFRQILEDAEFRRAALHTGFIHEFFQRRQPVEPPADATVVAALVAALHFVSQKPDAAPAANGAGPWLRAGRDGLLR